MRLERWWYTISLRLRSLFCRRDVDHELDEELQGHIERKAEQYVTKGYDPVEARRLAMLDMDGIERRKEECRDMRKVNWLHDLLQDVHYGGRTLAKSVGFTVVAVLTLALGIGANTAIFSVVRGVLLRPLPYAQPDRLALIRTDHSLKGWTDMPLPPGAYWEFQEQARALEGLAVFRQRTFTLIGGDEPQRIAAAAVTAKFFPVMGVQPQRGRAFLPEEDLPGGRNVCVSSRISTSIADRENAPLRSTGAVH